MAGKTKVLPLAASSPYAESQWKPDVNGNQGKGKGKAVDYDFYSKLRTEDQKNLCGEPRCAYSESSERQITPQALAYQPGSPIHHTRSNSEAIRGKMPTRNFSRPQQQPFIGMNPFTGLPIVRETGFEAGPSNKPPPPLWNTSETDLLDEDVPIFQSTSQNRQTQPFQESSQLSSKKLPRPPPSPMPVAFGSSQATPQQGVPVRSNSMQNSSIMPLDGTDRRESIQRKALPNIPQPTTSTHRFGLKSNDSSVSRNAPAPKATLLATKALDKPNHLDGERNGGGDSIFSLRRTRYFHHITNLASKALKAAESIMTADRTAVVSQPEDSPPRVVSPPPDYRFTSENLLTTSREAPKGRLRRLPSQETLPPAYDTLPPINRRPSLASISSDSISSVFTASPGQTSALSPASTGPSFVQDSPDERKNQLLSNGSSSPVSGAQNGWSWGLFKRTNKQPGDFTSDSKQDSNWPSSDSESDHSTPVNSRYTIQKSRPIKWDNLKRESDRFHDSLLSSIELRDITNASRASDSHEWRQSVPGSNNPWKDHMTRDEELAKALQEEEYRSAQFERDALLAHDLANGTAEDGDIELAYFMSKETEILISSTNASSSEPAQSYIDPDFLRAQEIQQQLDDEEEAISASLAAALKLQAEFDLDAQAEDEWEAWKKINVDECIVCGDEQHRDELCRPCKHAYCEGCLQEGFKTALKSKTPFKCCKETLDIDDCTGLETTFVTQYKEMVLELTTENPTYCSNKRCGQFLPPRTFAGDVGTCMSCRTKTCKHCRQRHHPGTFCPEDVDTVKVKELAKAKGWKTCPGCQHLIERKDGCLHMVCSRCQTAFCYRCSKKWRDCESTCPDPISATHPKI